LETRVQVGPFKNRAQAEAAKAKMEALGIKGLVLPPLGE
jgi:cell division septation protein DedD